MRWVKGYKIEPGADLTSANLVWALLHNTNVNGVIGYNP